MNPSTPMLRFTAVAIVLAFATAGCTKVLEKLRGDAGLTADDDTTIGDAATTTVTGTGAKNEADVLRYEREEKLASEPATIAKDDTKVRTFPGNGAVVGTLTKGTPVVKLAKYFATAILVTFEDPTGGTLMGWVPPSALAAAATASGAGTAAGTATPQTTATSARPSDAGARTSIADAGVKTADAGAAKAADAGAPKGAADAGAKPGTAPSSAVTPVEPKKTDIVFQPQAGKCPAGFLLSGPLCRRKCTADPECPRGTFCINGLGGKYCSTDKK